MRSCIVTANEHERDNYMCICIVMPALLCPHCYARTVTPAHTMRVASSWLQYCRYCLYSAIRAVDATASNSAPNETNVMYCDLEYRYKKREKKKIKGYGSMT